MPQRRQVLHQQEVVVAVFMIAKQGVDHRAGGVVHRQQQRERWAVVSQPPVITAVQLDQHARSWHPLATDPVLGWTATAGTAQSGVQQNPSQGGPADVDAFPFSQQLREMGMIDSLVSSACQMHHVGDHRHARGGDRSGAPVAVCQGRCSFLPVGCRDAAGVACADTHQLGRLTQCNLLR